MFIGSVIIIGEFHLYQILTIILAVISIVFMYTRVRSKKSTVPTFILWIIVWALILLFAFNSQIATPVAWIFGIGRGLDFLLIIGIFVCLYLIFKLYITIDELNQDITDLVRELAIVNEINEENLKELNKNDDVKK